MIVGAVAKVCDGMADVVLAGWGGQYVIYRPVANPALRMQFGLGKIAAVASFYKLCRAWYTGDPSHLIPGRVVVGAVSDGPVDFGKVFKP